MKTFNLYYAKHDWLVRVYVAVDTYYVEDIVEMLQTIGCSRKDCARAKGNLTSGYLDTGLCYSNYKDRISVLVIGKTSSSGQFLNSLTHEVTHLATHIAGASGIDLLSEDLCYMAGDIAMMMYDRCHDLLCCKCRRK